MSGVLKKCKDNTLLLSLFYLYGLRVVLQWHCALHWPVAVSFVRLVWMFIEWTNMMKSLILVFGTNKIIIIALLQKRQYKIMLYCFFIQYTNTIQLLYRNIKKKLKTKRNASSRCVCGKYKTNNSCSLYLQTDHSIYVC